MSRKQNKGMPSFAGRWRIYEMECWAKDYFDMEVEAFLRIDSGRSGEFQFGLVSGGIDGRITAQPDGERFEFTWEGSDECNPACGSGWMRKKGEKEVEGEIKIHQGDTSAFKARKMKPIAPSKRTKSKPKAGK